MSATFSPFNFPLIRFSPSMSLKRTIFMPIETKGGLNLGYLRLLYKHQSRTIDTSYYAKHKTKSTLVIISQLNGLPFLGKGIPLCSLMVFVFGSTSCCYGGSFHQFQTMLASSHVSSLQSMFMEQTSRFWRYWVSTFHAPIQMNQKFLLTQG